MIVQTGDLFVQPHFRRGYENVDNFEIPFFLWNLVTI